MDEDKDLTTVPLQDIKDEAGKARKEMGRSTEKLKLALHSLNVAGLPVNWSSPKKPASCTTSAPSNGV